MRSLIIFLFLYTTPSLFARHLIDTNVNMIGVWKGVYLDQSRPLSPYFIRIEFDTSTGSWWRSSVTQVGTDRWYFESMIKVVSLSGPTVSGGSFLGVIRNDSILLFIQRGAHFPGLFTMLGKRVKKLSDDSLSTFRHLYCGIGYRFKNGEELIFKGSTYGFFFIYKED